MPFTISTIFTAIDRMSAPLLRMQANTMRFNSSLGSGFASAESSINSFQKVTGGLTSKLFNLKNAIAGFALFEGGKQIYETMVKSAEGILELSHTSDRLGLSVQSLREFQYAAKLKGINPEMLIQGFDKLNKNLGGLKMNMGPLHSFLKKVAPSLEMQMKGAKNSGEAFYTLADAMKKIQDPAKRAVLAQAAFGKNGMIMVNMLSEGSAGLKKLREEFIKNQGLISEKDVENIKKFAEAQKKMQLAIQGVKIAILTKLVPAITPLIEKITDWITTNRELIAGKVKEYIEKIGKAIKAIIPFILYILKHIRLIITSILLLIATNALLKGLSISFMALRWAIAGVNFVLGICMAGQKSLPILLNANKAAMLGYAFAAKIAQAATWLFNIALSANPIGLIIIGIIACIAAITWLVIKWKDLTKWFDNSSASMKVVIGILAFMEWPIVWIAFVIRKLIDNWERLKKAFTDGGFLNGIKEIGKFIVSLILGPLQLMLKILGQIPGFSKFNKLADKINELRDKLTDEKKKPALVKALEKIPNVNKLNKTPDLSKIIKVPDKVNTNEAEKKKPVNLMATSIQSQTDRYEEIRKQQFELSLTNKTDKNVTVKKNGGLIPIITPTHERQNYVLLNND